MSDNRFQDCHTAGEVLWRFRAAVAESILNIVDQRKRYELTTDALARIAELTPPKDENLRDHAEHILRVHGLLNPTPRTVDEGARERAREVTYEWWLNTTGMSRANADQLVDRIIDALGWAAPEPEADPPGSHPVPDQRMEPSLSFTAIYNGTEPGVPAIALPTEMDGTGARIGGGQ